MNMKEAMQFRCSTADKAVLIVKLLLSSEVRASDIEVMSAEPIQEIESLIAGKSRLPIFVLGGAFLGIVAGFSLASGTARLYPINTGGMPIVSLLPVGIVTYETMMLFAVLFSLAGLLLEAGLLRKKPTDVPPHAQSIADGEVLVLARVNSSKIADELRAAADRS
jgi:hypothetical protein